MAVTLCSSPSQTLAGHVEIPSDKSITHRALILGAIATGQTHIHKPLLSADCLATLKALELCGCTFDIQAENIIVHGVGLKGLQAPQGFLDVGNSGTSARLLMGLLSAQPFNSMLTGDSSLRKRPMMRVMLPLTSMGANIECEHGRFLPAYIQSVSSLKGIEYRLPVASAQIKSSLLLAGLYAQGATKIIEPLPTRDHTARMLSKFGVEIVRSGASYHLTPPTSLSASQLHIPSDISSAAFFIIAACLLKDSDLTLKNIGINPTRCGILNVLKRMGANIQLSNRRSFGFEPVADIHVRYAKLKGCTIYPYEVPTLIDELPILMIAACFAAGTTHITGAQELRVKESDRISAMVNGIQALGGRAQALEDGAVIQQKALTGGCVESLGDHRIAMSFAVAGWLAKKPVYIRDCDNIETSFPNFLPLAQSCDLNLTSEQQQEPRHV